MRLRIDLAYDGSGFHGWAKQPGLRTVQEDARAGPRHGAAQHRHVLTVAGRTDAGVHARGQVAHVDVARRPVTAAAGRSHEPTLDAAPSPAQRRPRPRRPHPPGHRGSGRFRRQVLRGLAALCLPGRRPAGARGPAGARPRAQLAAPPRPRRDERRRAAPAGRARLRGLLPETAGRHHDPHAAGPALGARRRPASRWPPCGPTRSATPWCARWWARLIAVGEGRREPAWPAEVLARAASRPGREGEPRPRPDPRGGGLPTGRRPCCPRARSPGGALTHPEPLG